MSQVKVKLPGKAEWTVELVPRGDKRLILDGNPNWGMTYYRTRDIYIDEELDEDALDEVLLHELTHAMLFETQIKPTRKFDEEDVCETVGMYGRRIIELADKVHKKWSKQEA